MFNENHVLCAEVLLAKYFTENPSTEWHPVKTVLRAVRFQGITKSDFREARKRLGIESKSFEDGYKWRWPEDKDPNKVWADKSREVFK